MEYIRRLFGVTRDKDNPAPIGGEGPRGFVGGLWYELGDLQFKFLVAHGLLPKHVFIDVACGSLRAGVRLIPYLDAGNYLGIDIDASLIDHGKDIELGPALCAVKQPEFVVSDKFEFGKFPKRADFAIAQSLFTHLIRDDIELCFRNLRKQMNDNAIFYATFFEVETPLANPDKSHPHGTFRYTAREMEHIGNEAGWVMDYIGRWNHPREQKMLRFRPAV